MIKYFTFLTSLCLTFSVLAQEKEKIQWISFEEAIEKNETTPKKFLIDVYTSWCGWCKKMDATTFSHPKIAAYINENYWPVKLNAERKDTIVLGDQQFVNENPNKKRNAHQLAVALLNGKMSYPSIVYLDEKVELLQAVPGYYDAKSIEPILYFFGEDTYKNQSWEEYQKIFSSAISN